MKYIRKISAVLLAAALSACAQQSSSSSLPSEDAIVRDDDIYIFFTNDTHCGVEENLGFPAVKALVNETKQEHEYVSLVDTGDFVQGGIIGSFSAGEMIIQLMNAMEYDIVTLGNHEFDYGMPQLNRLMDMMQFPVTVCNVTYTGKNEDYFRDIPKYIIKEYGGTKVAFIGVVTPYSFTSSSPEYFREDGEFVYNLGEGNDGLTLAGIVQETVADARAEGADYVVLLTHLGSADMRDPYNAVSLIANTTGINAVIDGHAHIEVSGTEYPNAEGEDVLLASAGTKLEALGELIISPDGTFSSLLISEYDKKDETMQAEIDKCKEKVNEVLAEKVCDLSFPMPMVDENGARMTRNRETALGDLMSDSLRDAYGADIGLVNGGSIRHELVPGEITKASLFELLPFQNTTGICRMKGQKILDALEYGACFVESIPEFDGEAVGESGGFLVPSGLKYTIDTSIESSAHKGENGLFSSIDGERRVKDVQVLKDGEYVPLDPEEYYTVASTSFIFSSGDGNTAFEGAEVIISEGEVDLNVMIDFITKTGGIPDQYQAPQGRITIK